MAGSHTLRSRIWSGRGGPPGLGSQTLEDRFQRGPYDRLGELAGCVVRARTATFLARLQHHGARRYQIGGGVPVDHSIESGVQLLHGAGATDRPLDLRGQLAVGAVLHPLGAFARLFSQEGFEVDSGGRAVLLLRFDGNAPARCCFEAETHHGLVDRADVLYIESPVGDALGVEDDELLQHPMDRAVPDPRRFDPLQRLPRPEIAAFKKRVAIRTEKVTMFRRHVHLHGLCAVMDHAPQGKKLGVGAVALVHCVGVQGRVGSQPLIETGHRVSAEEGLVLRQQIPLLGIEQVDEAQHDGEQPAIDLVGIFRQPSPEQPSLGRVVGGLEASQKLVQCVQHLLGKAFRDLVLEFAAVLEQRRQALVPRQA